MEIDQTKNIDNTFKNHMDELKKSGKPFCCKCFDNRKVKLVSDMWLCKDCRYMMRLLNDIKKI